MAEHSFAINIPSPPEFVYDLWANPERSVEWTEGMTGVTDIACSPGEAGARYKAWFGRSPATVEVTKAERPTRYAWHVRLGPFAADFDSAFERTGSGTRMTETVRTAGLIAWLWNRILSTGRYRGSFRGELETFARICEREA